MILWFHVTWNIISVKRKGDLITIQITGNGFLYNMVRIITGTLILVGIHTIAAQKLLKSFVPTKKDAASCIADTSKGR